MEKPYKSEIKNIEIDQQNQGVGREKRKLKAS